MPWQTEVSAYWLHCVHLTRLGSGPKVLSQPVGKAAGLPLATDANIGRCETSTHRGVLPAGETDWQVMCCVMVAGVGGRVLAVLAEGPIAPSTALVEAGGYPLSPRLWILGTLALNTRSWMFLVLV